MRCMIQFHHNSTRDKSLCWSDCRMKGFYGILHPSWCSGSSGFVFILTRVQKDIILYECLIIILFKAI